MLSAIKDIVIAVMFWASILTGGYAAIPTIYNEVRSMTQHRVSRGLSSTVKFTEALIQPKGQ